MPRPAAMCLASAVTAFAGLTPALAQRYADSAADYSGVQGQRGWFYGYYTAPFTPATFQPLPRFGCFGSPENCEVWSRTPTWLGGYFTSLGPNNSGLPNATNSNPDVLREVNWPVRRWVSGVSGIAAITFYIRKLDTSGGDGVRGHLFVDGVEVWSAHIGWFNATGILAQVSACLHVGSVIDFALDPESSDTADATAFGFTVDGPLLGQPWDVQTCSNSGVILETLVADWDSPAFQWQVEVTRGSGVWCDLAEGQLGGGCLENGTYIGVHSPTLAILGGTGQQPLSESQDRNYRCVITGACATITTRAASVSICTTDYNCDGFVDFFDSDAFVNGFESGDPAADFNGDGFLDFFDTDAFFNTFEAGC